MSRIKLTQDGIANDLTISPYKTKVFYTANSYVIYVFSSKLYKGKFEERMEDNREKINRSLSNRFGFDIVNNLLCDMKLYTTIEKRGFLIKSNKEGFGCLSNLRLDGKTLIQKN